MIIYNARFQTGEVKEVINEMKAGKIPSMDVDDDNDFQYVLNKLQDNNIVIDQSVPFDKNARDKVKEPEFEYRVCFIDQKDPSGNRMYIDFYSEIPEDPTYASCSGD